MSVEYKRDVYLCGHKCVAWVRTPSRERHEIGKKAVVRNLLSGCSAPGMARRCSDGFKWCDASIPNNSRNCDGSSPGGEVDSRSGGGGARAHRAGRKRRRQTGVLPAEPVLQFSKFSEFQ